MRENATCTLFANETISLFLPVAYCFLCSKIKSVISCNVSRILSRGPDNPHKTALTIIRAVGDFEFNLAMKEPSLDSRSATKGVVAPTKIVFLSKYLSNAEKIPINQKPF